MERKPVLPPRSSDKGEKRGVLIWEGEARQLKLSATQAVALLEHLRADDTSQQDGIVAGEHVTRIVLPKRKGEPGLESETVLVNGMHLSPSRTKLLLRLLEKHEVQLREINEKEYKERERARGRAYRLILEYTPPRETKGQPATLRMKCPNLIHLNDHDLAEVVVIGPNV
jgi:hypothetical protein